MYEERYRYLYSDGTYKLWINPSQLLDAYHIDAFIGFSKKQNDFNDVSYIVNVAILPILGIIGIIGNVGGIICFSKKLYLSYYSLLFSLAIADLLTIASFISYYSFPHWVDYDTILEHPTCTYLILCSYYILHISQLICIYLIVSLSLERYFLICRPIVYHTRKLSSFYYLAPIIFLSILYCVPIFLDYRVDRVDLEKFYIKNGTLEGVGNKTLYLIKQEESKIHNEHYKIIYGVVSKLIVKGIVPYIALISTNISVLRTFKLSNSSPTKGVDDGKCTNSHGNNEHIELRLHTSTRGWKLRQKQMNVGYLNLMIAIMFLLCYSLVWIWGIYDLVNVVNALTSKVSFLSRVIIQIKQKLEI